MAKRIYKSVTAALLDALNETELSHRRIERDTGVKRASIMRFMRGETSLRLDVADKLVEYFGIEVHQTGKRKAE